MSIELKEAAEKALVVLCSATSFMSRKARDQHESVVAELSTAIQQAEAQQPDNAACKSVQKRLEAQQPAAGEPVHATVRNLLLELLNEPDRTLQQRPDRFRRVREAYELLYDHPAPSVPGDDFDLICNAIDKADSITMEGDYMLDSDDCIAVVRVMQVLLSVRAAMLAT